VRDWPDYEIGPNKDVRSIPRLRPGKGGSTRTIPGVTLKPDPVGRVWLCKEELKERHSVEDLFRVHWPELANTKPAMWCRIGHPLTPVTEWPADVLGDITRDWLDDQGAAHWIAPEVTYWGSGNRICRRCHPGELTFTTDTHHYPPEPYWCDYPRLRPDDKPVGVRRDEKRVRHDDLNIAFPPVVLVPERLQALDGMLRERP
jgi:hypothetical protein